MSVGTPMKFNLWTRLTHKGTGRRLLKQKLKEFHESCG